MKKILRNLTAICLSAMLLILGFYTVSAQTILVLENYDKELTNILTDRDVTEKSEQPLILVYETDKSTIGVDELASLDHTAKKTFVLGAKDMIGYTLYEVVEENEPKIEDWMFETYCKESTDYEEEIAIESWMMNPDEWIKK